MKKYQSILLFILGFGIFMFTRKSEFFPNISGSIIIAPILILRFIRIQPLLRGILLTLSGFLISMIFSLWGLYGHSFEMIMINNIRSSLLALLYFLPFMVDRIIYPRLKSKSLISSLIFPVMTTALFYLSSLEGPFDGDIAKSVYILGPLIFKQIGSVFGLWGFVFIYSWIASVINQMLENNFNWQKIRRSTIVVTSVLVVIYIFGIIKTSSFIIPKAKTVKIAAVIILPEDGDAVSMLDIYEKKSFSPYESTLSKIEMLTKKASANKAKIVSFQENSIIISQEDNDKLIKELKRIADENNVYLSFCYGYFSKNEKGANKHLLFSDEGKLLLDYQKRFLLGIGDIGETAVFKKGSEIIQSVDTPYGRIGLSICRDMNFSFYIKQAGKSKVDIMLGPSYDFPKSFGPCYTLRAIENGFSFIRPTYNGYSYAEDYNGKILAGMDSDNSYDGIMYADVPTKRIKTLFPNFESIFAWTCLFGMIGFIFFVIIISIIKKYKIKN